MADYTLSVDFDGNAEKLAKAVEQAKSKIGEFENKTKSLKDKLSNVAQKANDFGEKITKSLDKVPDKLQSIGSSVSKLGTKLTIGLTTPLVLMGKKMVGAASDFEENLNKVDVAFGKNAQEVIEWSKTVDKSFGLSKNQALEAVSLYGDMATSMGLSTKEASKMSTNLAGLAGDLSSFKNIDIKQAMNALNGVFTGETESLKRLGVVMTKTNLEQFAMSKGIKKKIKNMTEAEKVQLRYSYVLEKTKNAQGDYARTSDGTANSIRTLKSSVENLGIAFGQHILPVLTPIIQQVTNMVNAFATMPAPIQQAILKIGLFAIGLGPGVTVLGKFIGGVGSLIGVLNGFSTVVTNVGTFVLGLTGKISGLAGTVFGLMGKISGLAGTVFGLMGKISGLAGTVFGLASQFGGLATAIFSVLNLTAGIGIFLAGLGLLQTAFGEKINSFLETARTKGSEIITNLTNGIASKVGELVAKGGELMTNLLNTITANLPAIISGGVNIVVSLISGVASQLPTLIPAAINLIVTLVTGLIQNLPKIIKAGIKLVGGLVKGIFNALPQVVQSAIKIGLAILKQIVMLPHQMLVFGWELIKSLVSGIGQKMSEVPAKLGELIDRAKEKFSSIDWGEVGGNIIKGIANGVIGGAGALYNAAKNAASNALSTIKKKLGIHSPSRVFRDEVGKMMAMGVGVGFENNIPFKMLKEGVGRAVKAVGGISVKADMANNSPVGVPKIADYAMDNLKATYINKEGNTIAPQDYSFQIINNTNVDGTPLKEISADYTIKKINRNQKMETRARGAYA